jgi:hypothetical protein
MGSETTTGKVGIDAGAIIKIIQMFREKAQQRKEAAAIKSLFSGIGGAPTTTGGVPTTTPSVGVGQPATTTGIPAATTGQRQGVLGGLGQNANVQQLLGTETGRQAISDFFKLQKQARPADRKTLTDAQGRNRFVDTGELVFKDLEVPTTPELRIDDVTKFTSESIRAYESARKKGRASLSFLIPKSSFLNEKALGMSTGQAEDVARKEFNKLSKDFFTRRDSFAQIDALAKTDEPSAADDIAMIFAFMKMIDPPSVVREGEQATAANAAGVPDRLRNLYNRVLTGVRLAPAQRQNFRNTAQTIFDSQNIIHLQREAQYRGLAQRRDLNIDNILLPDKERKVTEPAGKPEVIDLKNLSDDELLEGL